MRHKSGLWNTLWTDMMIETTLMKTGKSPGGLKGVTLKPELVKKWAFSLNTFGNIDREIEEYFENDCEVLSPNTHKEEKMILESISMTSFLFMKRKSEVSKSTNKKPEVKIFIWKKMTASGRSLFYSKFSFFWSIFESFMETLAKMGKVGIFAWI